MIPRKALPPWATYPKDCCKVCGRLSPGYAANDDILCSTCIMWSSGIARMSIPKPIDDGIRHFA